jgi:hypothetical protein
MSIGRELFGFLMRSDLNVAKIAEGAGDDARYSGIDAPPEDLSAILERAARSGAIDSSPRTRRRLCLQCQVLKKKLADHLKILMRF